MKLLDLLPKRVRMTEPSLRVAETDAGKRFNQYMSIKKWVTDNEKILVLQGTKLEDKAETQVVMIITDNKQSENAQKNDKNNGRGNRGNNNRRQNGWNSRQQGSNQ